MNNSVSVMCIDDSNKPSIIPQDKWPVEGELYNISHIYVMRNEKQDGIKGCELVEFNIEQYLPYNCYRLDRFAVSVDDIEKLIQMAIDASKLNGINIDIDKLTKSVEQMQTLEHV